jgi:hypothetical protein
MPNTEDMLIDRMVGAEWSPAASPAMKRVGGLGTGYAIGQAQDR